MLQHLHEIYCAEKLSSILETLYKWYVVGKIFPKE